jgi:putative ATPase
MEFFKAGEDKLSAPLAERLRPRTLSELVGQEHILGSGKPLRRALEKGELFSMIFWGPPGSGKTTIAMLVAEFAQAHFVSFSAVTSGVADIRRVVKEAEYERKAHHQRTILFVDEIHRFNKAQQDAFLPFVESGAITLIGATTENPSFEVIGPLLSRTKVYVLNQLAPDELKVILNRALTDERGLEKFRPRVEDKAKEYLVMIADGDARRILNGLELCVMSAEPNAKGEREVTIELAEDVIQRKFLLYDRAGEEHYNLISAFIKSLRGSDPDAALYWLARMIEAGEDPLFIVRRMVILASEDIGNADPQALVVANAAREAVDFIGLPECRLALAQACIYLAVAPKSNAVIKAYEAAKEDALSTIAEPVPLHLRNPVTPLMKQLRYGRDYKYPHNFADGSVEQEYRPKNLRGRRYYYPSDRGYEGKLKKGEKKGD